MCKHCEEDENCQTNRSFRDVCRTKLFIMKLTHDFSQELV